MAPVLCERCRVFSRRLGKRCLNCRFQMVVLVGAILSSLLSVAAYAQSTPSFTFGQVPTATQWNTYFGGKVDTTNGVLNNPMITGGVISTATLNTVTLNNPIITGLTLNGLALTGALSTSNTMSGSGGSSALIGTIVPAGAGAPYVYGLTVTKLAASVEQGTTADAAVHIIGDFAATNGKSWHNGIVFGTAGSSASFPLDITGSLITIAGSDTDTTAIGVDMSGAFFLTAEFKGMGFLVDGSGNVTGNSFTANTHVGVSCAANSVSLTTLVVTSGIVTHC